MKVFLASALLGVFTISLAACGGSGEDNASDTSTSSNGDEKQVVVDVNEGEIETNSTTKAADATAIVELSPEFSGLPSPYKEANYARGKRVFRLCSSCHAIDDGSTHRVGPDLHGVFTRKIGDAPGFNYSDAVKEADFDWTPEQLEQWLANPRSFLPGNRMSFSGVRKPEDRVAVIAYLMAETAK